MAGEVSNPPVVPDFKPREAYPGEIDGDFVDRYTLLHGLFGVLCHRFGLGFLATMGLAVGWELAEKTLKGGPLKDFPWHRGDDGRVTDDRWPNMVGDVVATAVGYFVSDRYL